MFKSTDKGIDTWIGKDGLYYTAEQHETFTKGFEAYVLLHVTYLQ